MSQQSADAASVDPRAPRFGQAVTASLLFGAVALDRPALVGLTAAVLLAAVGSGWRLDLYGLAWRSLLVPLVGPPDASEPAAPHRFATLLGAGGTGLSTLSVLAGLPSLGVALAVAVAAAAGIAATTGVCLGCRCYRHVGFVRRLGVV